MYWWIYFLIVLTIVLISWMYYYGMLSQMKIHTYTLPKIEFLYYSIKGDYGEKMQFEYNKILDVISENINAHEGISFILFLTIYIAYNRGGKLMLGMYYDDPNQVKNKTNMRAVVGFIIKPSNDAQRELIKSQFVKYGYKYMNIDKPTKCLFAKFDIKPPRTVAYMVSPAQFYRQVDQFIRKHKKLRNMMALSTTKNM